MALAGIGAALVDRVAVATIAASFAVVLCIGPVTGIGRIWADGKPMDLSGVTWRW